MKKILAFVVLLSCFSTYAQNFEGVIKWTVNSEITDPETKAKMDEAAMKMTDPNTQARMKEMQAKVDDPQFKKMLETNPQMKAQIEASMKMMQGGGLQSMLPKAYEVHIKNQNMLTKVEGGIMAHQELLFLKDKDKSYSIDHEAKTYSVMSNPSKNTVKSESKVTKTAETIEVLNYTCTKYIIESEISGKKFKHLVWATNEIKNLNLKSFGSQRNQNGQAFSFEEIDGVPLKMEVYSKEGKMTMEAVILKEQSLPASQFIVPTSYKEVPPAFGF
jgi:hypothetical protein